LATDGELQASFQSVMEHYNKLVKEDPDHTKHPTQWLAFFDQAKQHYSKKQARIQQRIHAASTKLPRKPEDPIPTVLPCPDPYGAGDQFRVPKESDDDAELHNCMYHQIVLQQSNVFMKGHEDNHDVLRKSARECESFHFSNLLKAKAVPYVPFSDLDPAWIKAAILGLERFFTDRSKFYIEPDLSNPLNYVYPFPSARTTNSMGVLNLRIAIVGDLGTNDTIHTNTLKAIRDQNPDLVIHLGDIYVGGSNEECDEFWGIYENVFGKNSTRRPPLFCIPGNHEYISAGEGFFNRLVKTKRLGDPENPQKSSYFSLESEDLKLQILGLDTGYNSKNFSLPIGSETMDYSTSLHPDEAKWAQNRLQYAKDNGWRSIVLTHHQYFSAYWKQKMENTVLAEQILSAGQPITAWIWGHEHRIDIYDKELKNGNVKMAFCLGNGAMPEFTYVAANNSHPIDPKYTPRKKKLYSNQLEIYNSGFGILNIQEARPLAMNIYQVSRITGNCFPDGDQIKIS